MKKKEVGIICTIGPKTETKEMINKLIDAGMSVLRCNFSHGDIAEQIAKFKIVKEVGGERGIFIPCVCDTKGPDARLGEFKDGKAVIKDGQTFKLYFGDKYKSMLGDSNGVYAPYEKLFSIVKIGAELACNDGTVRMTIKEMKDNIITCEVTIGGVLKNRKALAAPGFDLQLPFIADYDIADITAAVAAGADWIAASNVNKIQDLIDLKALLKSCGGEKVKIVSKIEDRIGINNIDEIVKNSDGIMVARGGLGTDVPMWEVPALQKMIIEKCKKYKKFSVVATMMMETMIEKPMPTRAEISDIANAIWDGADYVMLSAESASGEYPVRAVDIMKKTIDEAVKHPKYIRAK